METCRSWLEDLERAKLVTIRGMSEAEERDTVDDVLGTLRTKRLVIETPFGIEIRMVPSQRFVNEDIHGSVVVFAGGEYHTLHRDKDGKWMRVIPRGGEATFVELSQDSFCDLILDIAQSVPGQLPAA